MYKLKLKNIPLIEVSKDGQMSCLRTEASEVLFPLKVTFALNQLTTLGLDLAMKSLLQPLLN